MLSYDKQAMAMALAEARYDPDRVIIVSPTILLVVNRPGFDPMTWPKKKWRKVEPEAGK